MQQVVQYGNRHWLNSHQVDVMLSAIDHSVFALVLGRTNEVEYVQGTGAGDYSVPDTDLFVGNPADYGLLQAGDAVFGRTSRVTGNLDMDGTVVLVNRTAPSGSNILFAMMDRTNSIRFALPKSAAGNATYNPRSMLNAGPAPVDDGCVTVGYWQTQGIFHNLACDTSGDGADLGVQNDLEVEGDIFTDSIKGSTDNTDITITPHGTGDIILSANVGIGTASPGETLEVNAPAPKIRFGRNASYYWDIGHTGSDFQFESQTGGVIVHMNYDGNVGIGSSSPNRKLHVHGAAVLTGDARTVAAFEDSTALAAGVGGGIALRGFYTGASTTMMGAVWVEKENATSGQYGASLHLGSREHGQTVTDDLVIAPGGNVGINKSAPANRVDIHDGASARSGTHTSGAPFYVTNTSSPDSGGAEFRHYNGTQGLGIGYNSIYAAGSNTDQNVSLMPKGTGGVGIGTVSPDCLLDVADGGDSTYNLTSTPSLILGVSGTKRGYIKLWGQTAGDYSVLQTTTNNLHMDCDVGGKTYINYYSQTMTCINGDGGTVGVGTSSARDQFHIHNAAAANVVANMTNNATGVGVGQGMSWWIDNYSRPTAMWNYENTPVTYGTNNSFYMYVLANHRVGLDTIAPARLLDVNQGSGNMIADGYDNHSLGEYKEEVSDVDYRGDLARLKQVPFKEWKRKPFVSTTELVKEAQAEFGLNPFDETGNHTQEHREWLKELDKDSEAYRWIGTRRKELRAERRGQKHWQRKYRGFVADDPETMALIPEVLSADEETGIVDGYSLNEYIALLHSALLDLAEQVEQLQH